MSNRLFFLICLLTLKGTITQAQQVSLFEELHGHITFEWYGQTHNIKDNSASGFDCNLSNVSSSTTDITIPNSALVKKAILYWSGSGSGDYEVQLSGPGFNNLMVSADRKFKEVFSLRDFFGGATDITNTLINAGSGTYTLSELNADKSFGHCIFNTIYAGWCILVVYEEASLPFSTVKIFDGFETVREATKSFPINNILIEATNNTKLGVLAWEGDDFDTQAESIFVNGTKISNGLNPVGHIFNGSNTSTNSSTNYNMDLDIFDISSFVNINDTSIPIDIKTGGDVIFLNALVLSYQNKLPDATIVIDTAFKTCDGDFTEVTFTVRNFNSNDVLPQGTSISFYENTTSGLLLSTTQTIADIAIDKSETQSIQITSSPAVLAAFIDNTSSIIELAENNNEYNKEVTQAITNPPTLLTDQICPKNFPYTLPDGTITITEGDFTFTLTAYNGCDSIIQLALMMLNTEYSLDYELCPMDSIFLEGEYHFRDTSFVATHPSSTGECDSLISYNIVFMPLQIDSILANLCPNESHPLPDGILVTEPGVYNSYTTCNQLTITTLTTNSSNHFITLTDSIFTSIGAAITLNPQLNFMGNTYIWTPELYLDCTDCLSTISTPQESIVYTFSTSDEYGCVLEKSISLKVMAIENEVFIPNTFSPNGDGQNEYFMVYGKTIKNIKLMRIYDRWGSLLFAQANLRNTKGWNGASHQKQLMNGVYVYQLQIEFNDGEIKTYSGDLTLKR